MELTDEQKQRVAISIEDQIEFIKNNFSVKEKRRKSIRTFLPYDFDQFIRLLSGYARLIICERRELDEFILNENNRPILELLHKYSINDKSIESKDFSLNKGIMLTGAFGCGKSVIMEAYCKMLNFKPRFNDQPQYDNHKFIKSQRLHDELNFEIRKDIQLDPSYRPKYSHLTIFIDEFGREPKFSKNFGEDIFPIINWLSFRYDNGLLTHGTSNFKYETLASNEFYGEMIGDRLKSMFNFVVLPGKSWRK
jgi:DNA replication protein DnaC